MLNFRVNEAKSQFFDRLKVIEALDAVALKAFSRFGAFVRRTARSSLRRPRRKKPHELTARELLIWDIRATEARRNGQPKPKLPFAPSNPGEPPRSITGVLKKFLFFAYDERARSVVIGPARVNARYRDVPRVLEEGGRTQTRHGPARIDARPYMKPAFDRELPQLPRLLREAA